MVYRYKDLSHIECHKERKALPKEQPKRIEKGERYDKLFCVIEESVAKEDKTSRRSNVFDMSWCDYYKANGVRFHYNDYIGTASYIESKCEYLMRKYDDWYMRARIVIHFLDGTTTTKYFDSDEEMLKYANGRFSDLNQRIRKDL